jgi:hypothetical protein
MPTYRIEVHFSGTLRFPIEADTPDDALREAQATWRDRIPAAAGEVLDIRDWLIGPPTEEPPASGPSRLQRALIAAGLVLTLTAPAFASSGGPRDAPWLVYQQIVQEQSWQIDPFAKAPGTNPALRAVIEGQGCEQTPATPPDVPSAGGGGMGP